jgi:hypothetical protein
LLASDRIDETAKQRLRKQFAALDPVTLLDAIRAAQQELSTFSNRDIGAAGSPDQPEYLVAFASAWHSDYRAPRGRRKTTTKHWWRTRADPFAESWPLLEGWLAAEPNLRCRRIADAAAPAITRSLPYRSAAPDLAAARQSLARRAGPRTGVCRRFYRTRSNRSSDVIVKATLWILDEES